MDFLSATAYKLALGPLSDTYPVGAGGSFPWDKAAKV